MNQPARIATAGITSGVVVLSMLAISLVVPALANPVAIAIGATAGLAFAFRDRLPHDSPAFRRGLAILVVASAAIGWLSLQSGYIGT